jgi:hypothetical protein
MSIVAIVALGAVLAVLVWLAFVLLVRRIRRPDQREPPHQRVPLDRPKVREPEPAPIRAEPVVPHGGIQLIAGVPVPSMPVPGEAAPAPAERGAVRDVEPVPSHGPARPRVRRLGMANHPHGSLVFMLGAINQTARSVREAKPADLDSSSADGRIRESSLGSAPGERDTEEC